LPTPDEAIRMLEQNGGGAAPVNGGSAARSVPSSAPASMQPSPARAMSASGGNGDGVARPQMSAPRPQAVSAPAALKISTFPELVALAGEKRDLMTRAALEADVRLVRIEDGRLELAMERSAARTLINDLSRKLEQWTGRRWSVIVSNEAGQPTLRSQTQLQQTERERAAESDPRVQEVMARFPGTKVIEVRRLATEPPESDASGEDPAESFDSDDQ
jgi:DNA polymerase-3 subunit gamma/tau